jgi:hypothetical protein
MKQNMMDRIIKLKKESTTLAGKPVLYILNNQVSQPPLLQKEGRFFQS